MAKRYAIADYLTDEQRALVMAKTWRADYCGLSTDVSSCPLGVALGFDSPFHHIVIDILGPESGDAVFEFMADVDANIITPEDLAVAIGAE